MEVSHSKKFPARTDMHLARKFWHIGVGVLALQSYFLTGWGPLRWGQISMAIALGGLLFDFARFYHPGFRQFAYRVVGLFMRENERESFSGLPFYALGISLSLLIFPEKIAVLSVFFLVFSDPIASIVGIRFGKTKIIHGKSLEGCLAAWSVCSLIAIFYLKHFEPHYTYWFSFSMLAGLIGSMSELFFQKLDDNLTIPVLSALGMSLLNLIFRVF